MGGSGGVATRRIPATRRWEGVVGRFVVPNPRKRQAWTNQCRRWTNQIGNARSGGEKAGNDTAKQSDHEVLANEKLFDSD